MQIIEHIQYEQEKLLEKRLELGFRNYFNIKNDTYHLNSLKGWMYSSMGITDRKHY